MEILDAKQLINSGSEGDALLRRVALSLPVGVLIVDAAGTITAANQEIEQQFGSTMTELIDRPVDTFLPGVPSLSDASRDPAVTTGTLRHRVGWRRDGSEFPIELGWRRLTTAHAVRVLVLVVDMTARRHVESQRSLLAEEQLEFERAVAEQAVAFINLPIDRVDDAIRDALRRTGEALNLDRSTFFRLQPDGIAVAPVGWERPGIPPAPAPVDVRAQFPWAYETIRAGRMLSFSSIDEIPSRLDREGFASMGVKSAVTMPLLVEGDVVGAVGFNALRTARSWPPDVVHRLSVFVTAFGSVLAQRQSDEAIREALAEAERLRNQLQSENVYLRAESQDRTGLDKIAGDSEAIRRVFDDVHRVAPTSATVLLLGETGTGKELFATQIHELSGRRGRPMVRVNCAAIPATLLESELFGREKGAFTGALTRQVGRFELADRSTIFLDEIGDLPADVQVKLLRVLEERQIERLGDPKPIRIDTRIIAATHRDLEQRVAEGTFREDLFYRLNVFPIHVPPLRDRAADIPQLVWRFVAEFSKAFGKRIDVIPSEDLEALQRYPWPGNIRELRNVVERAMILASSRRLTITLPTGRAPAGRHTERLLDVEKDHIREVLESAGWRIRGAGGAAERLGLKPTTLETRLARLGLKRAR
jgi:PAS domain S-box-containing protein